MKKLLIGLLLVISVLLTTRYAAAKPDTVIIPQNKPPSIMELAFLRSLDLPILRTMEEHRDQQLFTSSRIEKIFRNKEEDYYDISLRVIDFEGAHNPPYKLIRITFRVPDDYAKDKIFKVLSYKHRIITGDEFLKLSKYTN